MKSKVDWTLRLGKAALVLAAVIALSSCVISSGEKPIQEVYPPGGGPGTPVPDDTFDSGDDSGPVDPGIGEPDPSIPDPNPDQAAPAFGGLQSARVLSPSSVLLTWAPAADAFTQVYDLRYYLYIGSSPGGENLSKPNFITAPGSTVLLVTGLSPGSEYYFVVRSRDAAGNVDGNTVEKGVALLIWTTPTGTSDPVDDISKPFGDEPSLAFSKGDVFVGWVERGLSVFNRTHVMKWNGADKFLDVGSEDDLNENPDWGSEEVTVAVQGSDLYAAWHEEDHDLDANPIQGDVYVKRYDGTNNQWDLVGGGLAIDDPSLFNHIAEIGHSPNVIPETPHIAFVQENLSGVFQVIVRRWDEGAQSWETLPGSNPDGSLNRNPASSADLPILAYLGKVPYVTWREGSGANIYVWKWNDGAGAWEQVGGKINSGFTHKHPWLADDGSTLYIGWVEENSAKVSQAYVAKWDGSGWTKMGGALNIDSNEDADHVRLAVGTNGRVYAEWVEKDLVDVDQLYVRYWKGNEWVLAGESQNVAQDASVSEPHLAVDGNTPYVAWAEEKNSRSRVYVKMLP